MIMIVLLLLVGFMTLSILDSYILHNRIFKKNAMIRSKGGRITMSELKQGWIDPGENIPSENKGPYLVWDDTYFVWRLCHFVEGKWDEIRTRGVYPLRHTYYQELDVPEQVSEMKEVIK